jgi:DNA primase catalytic subunit
MDFGPVCEPTGQTLSDWKPYENHLVFDLDLEDYKGVFPESVEGNLTAPLWCHLVHSLRALYTLVDLLVVEPNNAKQDHVNAFGVFSGRRGVHLIFPALRRSWATTDQTQSILCAAAKLSESKSAAELVSLALNRGGVVADFVREIGEYAEGNLTTRTVQHMRRQKHLSSFDANDVERLIRERDSSMDERGPDVKRIDWCVVGVMMVAPKADYTVTADYTHLLKCPFSVHDKTGLVSLPFDITHDLATNLEAHLSGASIKGIAFNAKAREVLTKRVKNAASFLTDLMAKLYSSNSKE